MPELFMMIKSKKNVTKRNSRELEVNVSDEKRNIHLEKRSQILNSSPVGSPGNSAEMDIEKVPEPPTRRESRSRSNSNVAADQAAGGSEVGVPELGVRKFCEYIGSFSVAHLVPTSRAEFVRLQLQGLQSPEKSRPVMLFISLSGVKVCDPEDEKVVLMAHALKRISYATCDPDFGQFAFLARNPRGPCGIQYCHVFLTTEKREAEEINAIVARAFKVAYASLRSKNQFYELVQELNREQEEYFKQLTTAAEEGKRLRPEDLLDKQPLTSPDRVRGFVVGQSRVWAKHEAGKIQHKQPHKITGGAEPNVNLKYRPDSVAVTTQAAPSTSSSEPEEPSDDHEEWSGSLPQEEAPPVDGISIGAVSTEGGGEGEAVITPTAPPMTPGEITGQQELVTKHTQKCRPLPPAPYYSIERADEWSVNSISATITDPLRVIPEADASGCHILLQDERPPPILKEEMASAECQRGSPGQILLQDSSVPPPYVYGGGRENEGEPDGEASDGYNWNGYNDSDLNCDTYRDSEYSERDSFDYSRSYAILEQFINATVESATIDEWMDPDLRLSPTEKEAPVDFTEDSLPLVIQNGNNGANNHGDDHGNDQEKDHRNNNEEQEPKVDNPPKIRPQPAPRKNVPSRRSMTSDDEDQKRDSATAENQSEEGEATVIRRDREPSPVRRPQPAPRQLKSGQKSPSLPVKDTATQTSLKNGVLVTPKHISNGQLSPVEPVVPQRPTNITGQSSPAGQKVDNTEKKLVGSRAPGHKGHKVEIEIGKFRCKRSPSSGSAPPLPPRSTSLHGDNRSSSPLVKDITQASWFKAAIPREIAVEILQQEEKGAFIVRESKSHPGCFALSMKVDKDFNESGIANYLVVRTKNGGYTIKGFGRDFPDLPRLIHHYSMQREQLPCCLVLSRSNPLYEQEEEEGDDDTDAGDEDLDYMSLTDFRSVMDGMK